MQTIEMSAEEREVLYEVLEREFKGIEQEVFRTDTRDFKELLKHRRTVMEGLMVKLAAVPAPAHA
jgi:hypothetical protein